MSFAAGFFGLSGLGYAGVGIEQLSPGDDIGGRDGAILLANFSFLLGVAVSYLLFRRSCKRFEAEGNRMHPVAGLLTGLVLSAAAAFIFAGLAG